MDLTAQRGTSSVMHSQKTPGLFDRVHNEGYEQIVFCHDQSVGLKAIISVHDSTLGPGTGGCRMYPYETEEAALEDVLRLSKGMTYKAALANLELGGGKAVIIGDPKKDKTPELLRRFGQYVERLAGNYITAKDVGINGDDLRIVKTQTKHILGIEGEAGGSGDPSPMTAWGTYQGMKAAAAFAFGSPELKGKRVAMQGLGYVSHTLLEHITKEGATIVAADVDENTINAHREKFNLEIVSPEEILFQECDILSPNALGAVLNKESIPKLRCKVVAGAANNQLETPEDGQALFDRGIVYAPDYAINAGGLINIYHERLGYDANQAKDHTSQIYKTIEEVLARSKRENKPPHYIADRMAEERVEAGKRS